MFTRPVHRGYTKREVVLLLVCYVVLMAMVVFATCRFDAGHQSRQFREQTAEMRRSVGMRIGEIRTILAALAGMHYVADELNGAALSTFSAPLLEQSPYIQALGRFDRVSNEARYDYENQMSEQGLYRFAIRRVDLDGQIVYDGDRQRYYPVSILEPMLPATLPLLGSNFGSVMHFDTRYSAAIESSLPFAIPLPDLWPADGTLLLVTPVYRGQQLPLDLSERRSQADGGYWLAIDVERMLGEALEQIAAVSINVELQDAISSSILFSHAHRHRSRRDPASVFLPLQAAERWPVGSSTIALTLNSHQGLSVLAQFAGGMVALAISVLYLLIALVGYNRRVTDFDKRMSQHDLYAEREKAERTLNSITDAVLSVDDKLQVVHMNRTAENWFDTTNEQAEGKPVCRVIACRSSEDAAQRFDIDATLKSLGNGAECHADLSLASATSSDQIIRLSISRTVDEEADAAYLLVMRDVSVERRLTRELAYRANHDPLTGCSNRYYFEKRLAELVEDLPATERRHALVYMDLDQFKIVNDTCGHTAGDRLLIELTENLSALIRQSDVLARLGGDEFGVILVDTGIDDARSLADKIHRFFQSYVFQHDGQAFAVRASIGLVLIDQTAGDLSDILSAADIACYTAKDSGRNNVSVYADDDESMIRRHRDMNWAPLLQAALQENRFCLLVQSVASIGERIPQARVEHFEFLLRLRDEQGTQTSPLQFIQAAERYDLMLDIDRWVINDAMKQVAMLDAGLQKRYTFSINLSGQSAADPTLVGYLRTQFDTYGIDPARFWFEITETAAITHFSTAQELIESVRELGAKVALDDFGSGLSSFGYLKNLPVDVIKIDGQFVREIADNPFDREMVRAINRVAKSMNIATVAEFVENQAIMDELMRIGIDYAQGFHLGRPCPLTEALKQQQHAKAS